MIKGKVSTDGRTTIPKLVRAALNLSPGDELTYYIEANVVIITKLGAPEPLDPFIMFTEWDGDADRAAYTSL